MGSYYKVRKDAKTGDWIVTWGSNQPIPHHTYEDALDTVRYLLRLEKTYIITKRGHAIRKGRSK